jgi:hypothetical protein
MLISATSPWIRKSTMRSSSTTRAYSIPREKTIGPTISSVRIPTVDDALNAARTIASVHSATTTVVST